jgi:hypothetical protein
MLPLFVIHSTMGGHRGRMVVGLQLPMQSVHITTDVVDSIPAQGKVYNIM